MWRALYESHEATRALGNDQPDVLLRQRIKELVRLKHCNLRFPGKLTYKTETAHGREEIWVKGAEAGSMGEPIPLDGLPSLRDARLSLAATLDKRNGYLRSFTVRLEGTAPGDRPLLISVEMDEKPMSNGACGHPLIHCHVGPDHAATPELRLPMPPVKPWDALDWVLAQVVPGWEPAPWASVLPPPKKIER